MGDGWIARARAALVGSADRGGWGYRRGSPLAVEPTALAALGLLATAPGAGVDADPAARRAADALDRLRRPDGSTAVSAGLPGPGWATPYALLLWQAIGSHDEARRRAADWLLAEPVDARPRALVDPEGLAGHDPSIPGWPWAEGTHAWVEPTALAVLALRREGRAGSPRVADGVRLLRDRAIASGGWNYGNNVVYGRPLRPQPGPTGMALLALARGGTGAGPISSSRRTGLTPTSTPHPCPPPQGGRELSEPSPLEGEGRVGGGVEAGESAITRSASTYLCDELPNIRSAASLGWGLLGLRAWGVEPEGADAWLAEAAGAVLPRPDAAPRLGLLLLASAPRSLGLIGLQPPASRPR